MKSTALDRLIGYLDPGRGYRRLQARRALDLVETRLAVRGYDMAGKGRRGADWLTQSTSANTEIQTSLVLARDRHRDLRRNNPWAKRAIEAITTNTVGYGITGEIKVNGRESPTVNKRWQAWAEASTCDADGQHDLFGLQALIMTTVAESGECLIRRRVRRLQDGYPTPLQLQVMEPDYLDHSKTQQLPNGGRIVQGVEFDPIGGRVAYWLFRTHPGDPLGNPGTSYRVPASEIAHVFRVDRAGQVRGMPWGAAVGTTLRDLDDYEDAYLFRNKLANCLMGFVYDHAAGLDGGTTTSPLPETMEPGLIAQLPSGKDIKFAAPPATDSYGPFVSQLLYRIASGYGITYQALTGDLRSVNFSSGRMGWLEMQRNIDTWRWLMLIPQGLAKIANWWIEADALALGQVPGAAVHWTPPRREMIQPAEEVAALKDAVRSGITSLPEVHREFGANTRAVLREIADTNKQLDKLGIVLDSDPRKTSNTGINQAAKPAAAPAAAEPAQPSSEDEA